MADLQGEEQPKFQNNGKAVKEIVNFSLDKNHIIPHSF
jgi:hypothetical protein